MEILKYISTYLFVGCLFTAIIDMLNGWMKKQTKVEYKAPDMDQWNVNTRVLAIVLWPFALVVFLRSLLIKKK